MCCLSWLNSVADLINIMSYDYHVAGQGGVTGHNAPLYGPESVNTSVHAWLDAGADSAKLSLSVPFYGHSFTLADETKHGIGDSATTGIGGPLTQSPGVLGYNEVRTNF